MHVICFTLQVQVTTQIEYGHDTHTSSTNNQTKKRFSTDFYRSIFMNISFYVISFVFSKLVSLKSSMFFGKMPVHLFADSGELAS